MSQNSSYPLSEYQEAALSAMGIPLWRMREGGLKPVQHAETIAADTSVSEAPVHASEIPAESTVPPMLEPVAIPGKLLLMVEGQSGDVLSDILQALAWDMFPRHEAAGASPEHFCKAEAFWQTGAQVTLHGVQLTTPSLDTLDAKQKRQLWQLICTQNPQTYAGMQAAK